MPAKIPSTTCVTRLRMKFRKMREVYWLEAIASTIKTIENVTPTTVIMEPAIVDIIPRAPAAPTPNSCGHCASHWSLTADSASIKIAARVMLTTTITEGRSQKLDRSLLQNCLNLFMDRATRMVGKIVLFPDLRLRGANADSEHANAG